MDWKTEGENWGKNVAGSGYDKREIAPGWRANDFESAYKKHIKKCEESNKTPDDKEKSKEAFFTGWSKGIDEGYRNLKKSSGGGNINDHR